jgi:outer membrane biosynthesis protein TonB
MKRNDLIKTAEGIMEVIPCDPPIPLDEDTEDEDILTGIKEAAELIEPGDRDAFDEDTIEKLKLLKLWPFKDAVEEKAKPKRAAKPVPVEEGVEEEEVEEEVEEEEEAKPAKKVVGKPVAKAPAKPVPAPVKKEKPAPKEKVVKAPKEKKEVYSRVDAVCEALLDSPKSIDVWAKNADSFMETHGCKANTNEAKFIIRYIVKMAPHFDFGVKVPLT